MFGEPVDIDFTCVAFTRFFFFGLEDIGRALVASKQICAIFGLKEFAEGRDAFGDENEIILAEREDGIDEIVALALVADCLLYTSPSPRDRTRSRMPSSA